MMPFKNLSGKQPGGDRISGWDPRQDPLLSIWKWLDEEVEEGKERKKKDRRGQEATIVKITLQYLYEYCCFCRLDVSLLVWDTHT